MRFIRVYYRALRLLSREAGLVALLSIGSLAVAGLHSMDPLLFGRVVDLLSRSGDMATTELLPEAGKLLGLWAGIGIAGIVVNMMVALYAERLAHRNRLAVMTRYYSHVLAMPPSFHGDAHSGRLMKVMMGGADGLFGLWLSFFRDQLAVMASAFILLPLTLLMNWRLGIALILLVVVFCVMTALVIRRTEAGQKQAQTAQVNLAGTAQDALANVTVLQSFTRLSAETRLFGEIVDTVIKHQFPVLNWWALVNVLTRAASTLAVISIVVVGTWLHILGQASIADIVSFMGIAVLLIGRLESAVGFSSRLFQEMPGLSEMFDVLDAQSTVPERSFATTLERGAGEVVFDRVSFSYPDGASVLHDVSFAARPGTSVALVGQTGAGKTTAMALLQRLWDPQQGGVRIDGHDLRDVTLDSLRASVGVVFQESMLLNRSIRDNLLMGKPDATDAELEVACRQAEAHEFLVRLKHGYDTIIGERGTTLSGGQRQRLAIARALLKNPPILILDEATSALDAATEARVARALKALMAGRTTFIIAHRLSTIRDADEILVFDAGTIAERGSFDELVRHGGVFASLVSSQMARAA